MLLNYKFRTASNKHCWGLGMRLVWYGYQIHPPPSPSSPVPVSWISSVHLWLGWTRVPARTLLQFHALSPPEMICGESKGGKRVQKWKRYGGSLKCTWNVNLHFLHEGCLRIWEDNSINPAHRAGRLERERHATWIWQRNSTNEREDFSWPSWVEEVDSQIHILPFLTLATILNEGQSSKFKVTCVLHLASFPCSTIPYTRAWEQGYTVPSL